MMDHDAIACKDVARSTLRSRSIQRKGIHDGAPRHQADEAILDHQQAGRRRCSADRTRCYTRDVKSVAATLRERDAEDVRNMTPDERLALAFRLGDEDLESFRATHGLDRSAAIRLLERRRQATRRPSACLDRLIG